MGIGIGTRMGQRQRTVMDRDDGTGMDTIVDTIVVSD